MLIQHNLKMMLGRKTHNVRQPFSYPHKGSLVMGSQADEHRDESLGNRHHMHAATALVQREVGAYTFAT